MAHVRSHCAEGAKAGDHHHEWHGLARSGGSIAYRSSKAAVNMMMRSAAIDLAPRGITCVLVILDGSGPTSAVLRRRYRRRRALLPRDGSSMFGRNHSGRKTSMVNGARRSLNPRRRIRFQIRAPHPDERCENWPPKGDGESTSVMPGKSGSVTAPAK